jgi:hypothetical protein
LAARWAAARGPAGEGAGAEGWRGKKIRELGQIGAVGRGGEKERGRGARVGWAETCFPLFFSFSFLFSIYFSLTLCTSK